MVDETSDESFVTLDTNPPSRNEDIRSIPTNVSDDISNLDQTTPCYRSFRNLTRATDFRVVEQLENQSFYSLIEPIFTDASFPLVASIDTPAAIRNEQEKLQRFRYEFFSVNAGTSSYKASGVSLKKTSGSVQKMGTAYRIYACGMMGDVNNPEILIPLETIVILSH